MAPGLWEHSVRPSSRDMLVGGGPGHPPPEEAVRTQEIVLEVAMIPHPAPWAAALEGGSPRTSSSFLRGLDPTSVSVYHRGLLSSNGLSSRDLPYDSSPCLCPALLRRGGLVSPPPQGLRLWRDSAVPMLHHRVWHPGETGPTACQDCFLLATGPSARRP